MTKITIGVYKSFKNSGKRNHRDKTKKPWCHYFIDSHDEKFGTQYVSSIKAMILKRKVHKIRKFICEECGLVFTGAVKRDSDWCECPECP